MFASLYCQKAFNFLSLQKVRKEIQVCFVDSSSEIGFQSLFNPFSTNVPLTDKPGSWVLLAKCLKNIFYRCFKNFASINQLPGFYVSGTLVEDGFKKEL